MSIIKPIKAAPRDGTEVLLFCPEETPRWVSCLWRSAKENGETLWEGWAYSDAMLLDLCPEGPKNPTHYMPSIIPEIQDFAESRTIAPVEGQEGWSTFSQDINDDDDRAQPNRKWTAAQQETLNDNSGWGKSNNTPVWRNKNGDFPLITVKVIAKSGAYMDIPVMERDMFFD